MIRFYKDPRSIPGENKQEKDNKEEMRIDYFGYPYLKDCDLRSVRGIQGYQEAKKEIERIKQINSLIVKTKGNKRIPLNFLNEEDTEILENILASTPHLLSGVNILSRAFDKEELFYQAVVDAKKKLEKNYQN